MVFLVADWGEAPGKHTRKWLSGRASPCQGEGRGFESRLPLGEAIASRWSGREARQRPAKPCTRVQIPSPPPRTISSAGERFPDTEEVTGSIPVSSTTRTDRSANALRRPVDQGHRGEASPARGSGSVVEHHLAKVRVAGSNPVFRSERPSPRGGVAERRGNGLQSRVHGFKSRLHLHGRLAQRESASLTRKRSLVQSQYRPPPGPTGRRTHFVGRSTRDTAGKPPPHAEVAQW